MAKVRATISFAGIVTMGAGEEREIMDDHICKDLLKAGYVEEIKEELIPAKRRKKGDGM